MIGKVKNSGLIEPEKMVIAARTNISAYFPPMMHIPIVLIAESNIMISLIDGQK